MKRFQSFEEAAIIASDENKVDTPEWRAAVNYCIMHAPPEMLAELRASFRRYFPTIRPYGYDEAGNPYFRIDDIKRELGMSDADIRRIMRENGIDFGDDIKINPVQ